MNFNWPIPQPFHTKGVYVSQLFGQDFWDLKINNWHYKTLYGMNGHNGADLAAPRGTIVYCPKDSYLVECTSKDTGFGLRITLAWQEDGFIWMLVLGHFLNTYFSDKLFTSVLDRNKFVSAYARIAQVDSTGDSNGDHIHIGLYKHDLQGDRLLTTNGYGGAIDPLPYLKDWEMSNVLTVKKGNEIGFYVPATNEDAIIDKAMNFGVALPKTADGKKVDWANFHPDLIINQ